MAGRYMEVVLHLLVVMAVGTNACHNPDRDGIAITVGRRCESSGASIAIIICKEGVSTVMIPCQSFACVKLYSDHRYKVWHFGANFGAVIIIVLHALLYFIRLYTIWFLQLLMCRKVVRWRLMSWLVNYLAKWISLCVWKMVSLKRVVEVILCVLLYIALNHALILQQPCLYWYQIKFYWPECYEV